MNHKLLLDTAVLAGRGDYAVQWCGNVSGRRYDVSYFKNFRSGVHRGAGVKYIGIVATLNSPDMEQPMTIMKAVNDRTTNLNHIIQVNDISRRYCGGELTL